MQVLCVGFPRSGTESLQQALLQLGYDHTYHGWDIIFDHHAGYAPGWVRLARKKFYGDGSRITADEFDEVLGHSVAVADCPAAVFAADLVAAYPEAKVVLNMRRDVEAWERSLDVTLGAALESWKVRAKSWLDRESFWRLHVFYRFLLPLLFRAPDGDMGRAFQGNARWVLEEHCNMIRGLVPKDRLLEWYLGDGWEPLCGFLGKPVPDTEFPHVNTAGGGWKARIKTIRKGQMDRIFVNLMLLGGLLLAYMAATRFVDVTALFAGSS